MLVEQIRNLGIRRAGGTSPTAEAGSVEENRRLIRCEVQAYCQEHGGGNTQDKKHQSKIGKDLLSRPHHRINVIFSGCHDLTSGKKKVTGRNIIEVAPRYHGQVYPLARVL